MLLRLGPVQCGFSTGCDLHLQVTSASSSSCDGTITGSLRVVRSWNLQWPQRFLGDQFVVDSWQVPANLPGHRVMSL